MDAVNTVVCFCASSGPKKDKDKPMFIKTLLKGKDPRVHPCRCVACVQQHNAARLLKS